MNQYNQIPLHEDIPKVKEPTNQEPTVELNRTRLNLFGEAAQNLSLKSEQVAKNLASQELNSDQKERIDVKKSEIAGKVEKIKSLLSKITMGKVLLGASVSAAMVGASALGVHDALNSSPIEQLNTAVMLLAGVVVSGAVGLIYAEETKSIRY